MTALEIFFALQLDRVTQALRQPRQTFAHPVHLSPRQIASRKAVAQRRYYAMRKAQGFCRSCPNPVQAGHTRCGGCRVRHNRAQRHTGAGRRFFHRARGEAA